MSSIDERGVWRSASAAPLIRRFRVALAAMLGDRTDKAVAQRTAALAFAVRVASAGIGFVSQILLARWLGQHDYGIYAFVWVFILVAGALTPLGFSTTAQRFIPEYRASGRLDLARGFAAGSRIFVLLLSGGLALLGALAVTLLAPRLPPDYVLPLYVGLSCLPAFALMDVQDGISRNFNWIGIGLGLPYLIRPAMILVIVGAAMAIYGRAGAFDAILATAIAVWTTGFVQMLFLARRLPSRIERGRRSYAWRSWLATSAPIFLVDGFYVLLTNADIMILSAMADPASVGVYYAAVKVLALVSFVPFAVTAATSHKYAEYYAGGQREELERFVSDSVAWTFWPAFGATALILIVGKPLLWLFGTGFAGAYPVLFVLAIGLLARASVGPADRVLNMMGQQNACALVHGVSLVVNIALNVILIPKMGFYGAATATTSAMVFESVLLYLVARRRLGLNVFILRLATGRLEPVVAAAAREDQP